MSILFRAVFCYARNFNAAIHVLKIVKIVFFQRSVIKHLNNPIFAHDMDCYFSYTFFIESTLMRTAGSTTGHCVYSEWICEH